MLCIQEPGFYTTVQDRGRHGYRAYGMPLAGALDHYSFAVANLLTGNRQDAAVLEMTAKGPTISFECDAMAALTGAEMDIHLNDEKLENWSSFFVSSGSTLTSGSVKSGMRTYLALRGGIDVPTFLTSRSTYARGALGGHKGRALAKGDMLQPGRETDKKASIVSLPGRFIPYYGEETVLRALRGPRDDAFTDKALSLFFSRPYTVSNESDRMGYRLQAGPRLEFKAGPDIVSEPVTPGSVQVPGDGLPIILMADSHTTGGYNRIATVISVDLPLIAQTAPGGNIRFAEVTEKEALEALHREKTMLDEIALWLEKGCRNEKPAAFRVRVDDAHYQVRLLRE
jgi:antagonist of KipI